MEKIWTAMLDDRYECSVTRIDESRGNLIVRDKQDERILLNETVNLAYGAIFGPDFDDVAIWQMKAMEVVDARP